MPSLAQARRPKGDRGTKSTQYPLWIDPYREEGEFTIIMNLMTYFP